MASYDAPYPSPPRQVTTNGLAIASLVLGVLWLWWLGSILALVFGYVALRQIRRANGWQQGRGLAIAGIVLGWVGVAMAAVATVLLAVAVRDADDPVDRVETGPEAPAEQFQEPVPPPDEGYVPEAPDQTIPEVPDETGLPVVAPDAAVFAQLVTAICDEGGDSSTHQQVMEEHRAANPVLWAAIDTVVPSGDPTSSQCATGLAASDADLQALAFAIPSAPAGPSWPPLEAALDGLRPLADPGVLVSGTTPVEWRVGLAQLVAAICDEGPEPSTHVQVLEEHRAVNPGLWASIDGVMSPADPTSADCASGVAASDADLQALASADPPDPAGPSWPSLDTALATMRS